MGRIKGVRKQTDNRFLNLYELDAQFRNGTRAPYYVASRRTSPEQLKAISGDRKTDGVVLYGIYGAQKDHLVLIRQYRYPLGDYVYELPSGLVDPGENMEQAAVREMYEETGLTFRPLPCGACSRPFYTSIGMTDESCGTVFGYCSGTPTNAHQEESEDIQVIIADRAECRRILAEENVAIMCAYMMMNFITSGDDPLSFLKEISYV